MAYVVEGICTNKKVYQINNVLQDFEGGLFICLKTFAGFGYDHVERYHTKTGCSVFLHMLRHKIEVSSL